MKIIYDPRTKEGTKKDISCPVCGEKRKFIDCMAGGISETQGLFHHARGFFTIKFYSVDRYKCWTCGCIWESDPYVINT